MATANPLSRSDVLGGDDDEGGMTFEDTGATPGEGGGDDLDLLAEDQGGEGGVDDGGLVILDEDQGGDEDHEIRGHDAGGERIGQNEEDSGEVIDPLTLLSKEEKAVWSVAMQKRVGRERRQKQIERTRADQAAAQVAKLNAELFAERKKTLEAQKYATDLMVSGQTANLEALQGKLEKAIDDGDSKEQARIQTQISDLQITLGDLKKGQAMLEAKMKEEPPKPPQVNTEAAAWIARNMWFSNPQFAHQQAIAKTLDGELGKEVEAGSFPHAPNTREYMAELDRRIHLNMPQLRTRIRQVYGGTAPKPRVAPVSGGAAQIRRGKRRMVLSRQDVENFKNFGGDVNNKAALLEYARAKQHEGAMTHE